MNITYCKDYETMSEVAASLVISEIQTRKNSLLCMATGNSPMGLYNKLVESSQVDQANFKELRMVKLDEWGGVHENDPITCEYYLRTRVLNPLKISSDRYISFISNPLHPKEECRRVQSELDQQGPIDICILGLGKNGHIGFNEPDSHLQPFCHVANLSEDSLTHSMVQSMDQKPNFGLTLGMKDILNSKKIILLVTGKDKKKVIEHLEQKKVTTNLPASFLWLHKTVECIIDQNVFLKS